MNKCTGEGNKIWEGKMITRLFDFFFFFLSITENIKIEKKKREIEREISDNTANDVSNLSKRKIGTIRILSVCWKSGKSSWFHRF